MYKNILFFMLLFFSYWLNAILGAGEHWVTKHEIRILSSHNNVPIIRTLIMFYGCDNPSTAAIQKMCLESGYELIKILDHKKLDQRFIFTYEQSHAFCTMPHN